MTRIRLDDDSDVRDRIKKKILSRCERDPRTGCLIYLGCWRKNGQGRVRVGHFVFDTSRVAAWIHHNLDLFGDLYTSTSCLNQACVAKNHIVIGTVKEVIGRTPLFRKRRG